MNNWFVKNLGEAIWAEESLDSIKVLFLSEYEKANCPNDMAIFIRHELEGNLHCEVKIYFSPATIVFAHSVKAIPCKKPSLSSLDLFAGSDKSWSVLFPNKLNK
ncbi:MAG: hypothetical protein D8M58_19130 [Calditrichaeota bacterium]|nr:MAG: hypothetical protein DWQ03_21810 [Calditrichota bacterium]MBL1207525.1 hypothetical protein [Calditrichota bacterium]NOG47357.1 hypothetical protein [Calditrichota bacterium]